MKKFLSIVLTLIMLFSVAAPAMTASAASGCVTVYIQGYGATLKEANGEIIWENGPKESMMTGLSDILDDLLVDLGKGIVTGDYTEYCDRLYNAMAPAFSNLILDKNGEASDGTGTQYDMLTGYYGVSYSTFSNGTIDFIYDWRLSSVHNAEILEQFIERICRERGYSKVNILGRCLGANVVSAFLENAEESTLNKINKVIMYVPSTEGVDFISALFSGEIVINDQAVDNFVKYTLTENEGINDKFGIEGDISDVLITIVQFVNQAKILGVGTDVIEGILNAVKDNVLARIVRDSYGGFVGYWDMVSEEYIDKAIDFIYNTPELKSEYAGMIEKIRDYDAVRENARKTLKEIDDSGKEVMVISKYNFANFPLSKDAAKQCDNTALTSATSFGATVADFGKTLSDKYISSMPEENLKYLSADKMIDASTCVLPDSTWFIKNNVHDNFPASVDRLIDTFISSDGMTVFSDERYPQYMKYDKTTGDISPVTGLDEGDIIKTDKKEKASIFIRFFTLVINFLNKLFNGKIDFSNLLGGIGGEEAAA